MELKLKTAEYEYWEQVAFNPFCGEVNKENIVPDSCADIARIVETTGAVQITGREITEDGRISAIGTVRVDILYIAEKESAPRALHLHIPFQCGADDQCGFDPRFCDITAALQSVETRLLNPRKVLTHANILFRPVCCRSVSNSIPEDAQEGDHIQLLRAEKAYKVISTVREKEFSFTEDLAISPGKTGAAEVISARAELHPADCRLIGSKLVLKGLAGIVILYRDTDGYTATFQQEVPYSQILDGSGIEEDWELDPTVTVCDIRCAPGTDASPHDPHGLQLTVQLRARVIAMRTVQFRLIKDLYSTEGDVRCESMTLTLREDEQCQKRRQNGRAVLETGTAVKSVIDAQALCSGTGVRTNGDLLEAEVMLRCLYVDEHDGLHAVHGTVPLSLKIQRPASAVIRGRIHMGQDITVTIVPEGVELRWPLEWEFDQYVSVAFSCISSAEILQTEQTAAAPRPSLILRRAGEGECLWNLAKQYRTTCAAILEVNRLTQDDPLPRDRLLLIPRA